MYSRTAAVALPLTIVLLAAAFVGGRALRPAAGDGSPYLSALLAPSGGEAAALPALAPVRAEPPPPPPRPRDTMPPIIRGIFVHAYAIGSPERRARLLALADTTEINAFVVDVKDEDGVRYRSEIPLAMEATHAGSIPIRDLRGIADTLVARGIHPIARIVVFKDRRLSGVRPEWSIRTPEGGLWRDHQGVSWVSPWDPNVWDLNIAVAEEAARAGFREIQFDYVRFPEAYRSLPRQVHPHADGDRTAAIERFLAQARERLHPLGVTVTADVFGLSMNDPRDVGIGHQWERLSVVADHLLPMVYPSHYFPTHLRGIPRPNRMPYETVLASAGMGVERNRRMEAAGVEPARIVTWLQAFTATWNDRGYPYGPEQARAQIRALYELGLEDWIFWHPGADYEQIAGAFERELAPRAGAFRAAEAWTAAVDRFDRDGVAGVREGLASVAAGAVSGD
jgi:hypothetical protein